MPLHFVAKIGKAPLTNPMGVLTTFVFVDSNVAVVLDFRSVPLSKLGPTARAMDMIIMTIDHDDENPFIYRISLNVVNESCSNFLSDRRITLFCGPNQVDHDFSVWHNVVLLI